MGRLKINFDFDSVLVETIKAIHDVYVNRHYNEIISGMIPMPLPYFIKRWNFGDELPMMSNKELDSIFQSPEFFNCASFITDPNGFSMKDLFEELCMDSRFDIHVATRGTSSNLELKRKFIQKEFPSHMFDMDNFHGLLGTEMEKSQVNGWMLIDDVVNNLVTANVKHRVLFSHRGILDCEWNKDYVNYPDIIVCTSVRELCNKIIELYEFERVR